jgi:hypothetical protein
MGGITTVGGVMKGVSDMKRIKIEWRKLRVFRRLDELEAAVERIERHVGMREPAVMGVDVPSREKIGGGETAGDGYGNPSQSPTAGGMESVSARSGEKVGDGYGNPSQSPTAGGEKVPTAEEIMMMWRYPADEIADMNRPVGGGSR